MITTSCGVPALRLVDRSAVMTDKDELYDEIARMLADEGSWHQSIADDLSCDAGNFDGGNTRDCEHCQHRRRSDAIEALLTKIDFYASQTAW